MKNNDKETLLTTLRCQHSLAKELRQGQLRLATTLTDEPVDPLMRRERRGFALRLSCLAAFVALVTYSCFPATDNTAMRLERYASREQAFNDTFNLLHRQ